MGRILKVDGTPFREQDFDQEAECVARLPETAQPFEERERVALLERRHDLLYAGGTPTGDVLRTELLDVASRAISAKAYDVADALLSVAHARDLGMESMIATYLRELLIEAGESDVWEQVCTGCGCTDDDACEAGCCWIEPGLCSACADKILDRGPGD